MKIGIENYEINGKIVDIEFTDGSTSQEFFGEIDGEKEDIDDVLETALWKKSRTEYITIEVCPHCGQEYELNKFPKRNGFKVCGCGWINAGIGNDPLFEKVEC